MSDYCSHCRYPLEKHPKKWTNLQGGENLVCDGTGIKPEKKKRKGYIGKGNWNEWEIARALSLWLTEGRDKTQLIRSVQSGGHLGLRTAAVNQVGDLAPNGSAGEEFRKWFGIECKNYSSDPEWWHAFTSEKWIVAQWWSKIKKECREAPRSAGDPDLEPLLIMKRNRCPIVVMIKTDICDNAGINPTLHLRALDADIILLDEFISIPPTQWYGAIKDMYR